MNQSNRIIWVDIAKGIGILLVLIGHISQNQYISSFIYCFHMPLFFIISGYLYSDKQHYVKKKIKSILIPYLFFAIISFLYWYIIERNLRGQDINPLNSFLNIWLARGGDANYIFNVALWFLPCLLTVELMFHLLVKKIKSIKVLSAIIFLFSIIGYLYAQFHLIRLPFGIDIAFIAIGFYFLGYLWRQKGEIYLKKLNLNIMKRIIIICICFLLVVIISQLTGNLNMNNLQYPFYPLIYILAITGTFMVYLIATSLKENKILQYLGTNTLIIMGIHEPIKRVIIELMERITRIPAEILRTNLIGIIVLTIILSIICIPFIFMIKRYFPFLIGRKKEKEYVNH